MCARLECTVLHNCALVVVAFASVLGLESVSFEVKKDNLRWLVHVER